MANNFKYKIICIVFIYYFSFLIIFTILLCILYNSNYVIILCNIIFNLKYLFIFNKNKEIYGKYI